MVYEVVFRLLLHHFPPVPNRLRHQLCHAQQIIRRSDPPSRQLRSLGSPKTRFPKPSHRLDPTKYLFHSFSYPLTYAVARMTSRSTIDGRSTFSFRVGRHVRGDLSATQKTHKIISVIALVGSQTFDLQSLLPLTFHHALSRFPLSAARGLTDFEIDQQPISVPSAHAPRNSA